jgi:hypothetical protein
MLLNKKYKDLVIIWACFLCSNFLCAQKKVLTLNNLYKNPYCIEMALYHMRTVCDSLDDGEYFVYFDSSLTRLYCRGVLKNHQKQRIWEYYEWSGKKQYSLPYTNGKLNGKIVRYRYQGDTMQIMNCKEGKKEGATFNWEENFNPKYKSKKRLRWITWYKNDTIVSSEEFYEFQNLIYKKVGDSIFSISYSAYNSLLKEPKNYKQQFVRVTTDDNKSARTTYSIQIDLAKPSSIQLIDSLPLYVNLNSCYVYRYTEHKDDYYIDSLMSKIIHRLAVLKYFSSLHIEGPQLCATKDLGLLKNLTSLSLRSTKVINPEISKLSNLESLYMTGMRDSNYVFPVGFSNLKKMYYLGLQFMLMENPETEISKLHLLPSLRNLFLDVGLKEFPISLTKMNKLNQLTLVDNYQSINSITRIPEEVIQMRNPYHFTISEGALGGFRREFFEKNLPNCYFVFVY